MRRILLFGGTFDPPHFGHLAAADQVRNELGVDVVRFVVANNPWQKTSSGKDVTNVAIRLALVNAAVADADEFETSSVEAELGGASYMSRTLDHLATTEPDVEWLVAVGSDVAGGLGSWHDAQRLSQQSTFVVFERTGFPLSPTRQPPGGFTWLKVPVDAPEISSTTLRRRVATGRSIRYLAPDKVISLIDSHGLYGRAE